MKVHTFKLGIFPGAILPFIVGYLADAATAVGDVTATEEASAVETEGPRHDERIQGCLLADGESCSIRAANNERMHGNPRLHVTTLFV